MNLCALSIYKGNVTVANNKLKYSLLWLILFTIIINSSAQKNCVVNSIEIVGNKKTKNSIILRELSFKVGDEISLSSIDKNITLSQQNLINTSLFNSAIILGNFNADSTQINFTITLRERWYVWPSPIFEVQDRNFNTWWQTKDFFRINYGAFLTFENMRGRNENLTLKYRRGYTELIGAAYKVPYINKKQKIGINFSYFFSRNNEIAYTTYGNKLRFYRSLNGYVRKEHEAKIGFTYRENLYVKHALDLQYNSSNVIDTIRKLNRFYYVNDVSTVNYFSIKYYLRYEKRDNKAYPLKGMYAELNLSKEGLRLLPTEKVDNISVSASIKNYYKLFNRTYFSSSLKGRLLKNNSPIYYFQRALGWNDFVRGYEYYVIDGQNYGIAKANLKFQIIKPHIQNIPIKRLEKFNKVPYSLYFNAYIDAGYVKDNYFGDNNPLSNSKLIGTGIGLDFVSFYDYVLRIEVSRNLLRQKGLFLHFVAPI